MKLNWIEITTTFFYLGKIPKMPGTAGSLGALPIILTLKLFPPYVYSTFLILIFFLAYFSIKASENKLHLSSSQKPHDPPEIVIDEVLGMTIAAAWVPNSFFYLFTAFILFRFFDILKPFPIHWLEKKIKGPISILLDDALAGLFSQIILHLTPALITLESIKKDSF